MLHTEVPEQIACPRSDGGFTAQGSDAHGKCKVSAQYLNLQNISPHAFFSQLITPMAWHQHQNFYFMLYLRERVPITAAEPETMQIKHLRAWMRTSPLRSSCGGGMAASEEEEEDGLLCAALQPPWEREAGCQLGGHRSSACNCANTNAAKANFTEFHSADSSLS